jgi:hypothetical protein
MARSRVSKRVASTSARGTHVLDFLTAEDLAPDPTPNKVLATPDGTSTAWIDAGGGGPHSHVTSDVTGLADALAAKVATTDPRLSDARTPAAHAHGWDAVTDKPSTFTPSSHSHAIADSTGLQAALDGKVGTADARLTDARAPLAHTQAISTITNLQAALDAKSDVGHTHAGGSSSINVLRTTSHQTVNGTAFRDITGLTFPVSAGADFAFKFYIVFQSLTTTTGFRFAINGPAGATCDYFMTYQTIANSTTAGVATWLQGHWVVFDTMTATTAAIAANVDLVCMIEGRICVNGTPGTLAARVASELANSDLTIRKGSWGTWF